MLSLNASMFAAWYNASGRLILANTIPFMQDFVLLLLFSHALGFSVYGIWAAIALAPFVTLLILTTVVCVFRLKDKSLSFPLLFDQKRLERGSYVSFSVDSSLDKVSAASARISEFCEENGLTPKDTMLISMSVEELLGLIVSNNPGQGGFSIAVRLFILHGTTILRIRNGGARFNPIKYYEDNISSDLERSLDIIGIKYIVSSAKIIYYRETFGVNNLVVIL